MTHFLRLKKKFWWAHKKLNKFFCIEMCQPRNFCISGNKKVLDISSKMCLCLAQFWYFLLYVDFFHDPYLVLVLIQQPAFKITKNLRVGFQQKDRTKRTTHSLFVLPLLGSNPRSSQINKNLRVGFEQNCHLYSISNRF